MEYLFYVLNGVSYGMLLFILASGFTIILGTMGILNMAYGSFYLLGVYVAYSVMMTTGNFFLALLAATLAMGIFGIVIQYGLLARIPKLQTQQFLLTYGLILMIAEGTRMIWGPRPLMPPLPGFLMGTLPMGDFYFPVYRIALIVSGVIIAVLLWFFLEKTKWGAILRAGKDDAEMAEGIGLNIPFIWVMLFGLGSLMTGLAAGLGGHIIPAAPATTWTVLLMVYVVIIMGGIGSLKGALVASIFVGILDNIGRSLFPELAMFLIFTSLVIVLVVKPKGFFGKE